jgi:RND family efflux transporter MFP subunit
MLMTLQNRTRVWGIVPWVVLGLSAALLFANLMLHDQLFHHRLSASAAKSDEASNDTNAALATTVRLPEGKFQAAGISCEPATVVDLPSEVGVSGRIEVNRDHEVQIYPRASGVIRSVHVVLGQNVKKGQLLAVLDSPAVATARLELRAKQRDLATVKIEADWKRLVAANVTTLIPELRKGIEAGEIQRQYANRPLGTFRALLLQAYADFDIASHEEEKTASLFKDKIVGEHPAFVSKHTREGVQAKFEAALEQARFDANQQSLVANQAVRLAEGGVIDAAQRLRILGVVADVDELIANADAAVAAKVTDEDISAYPIVAPFDGAILTKDAVPSQKADLNDVLFTVADLSTVWVQANIPESSFGLLPRLEGGTIRLTASAYPGRRFEARLLSIGKVVEPSTRTVPLLAETSNTEELLKIGMFVRIELDSNEEEKALTVPLSAVVEVEGRKAVFVPDAKDSRTFHFHPLKLGREAGARQVVASGLKVGDLVVSKGAFTLKSELILQNETEEE